MRPGGKDSAHGTPESSDEEPSSNPLEPEFAAAVAPEAEEDGDENVESTATAMPPNVAGGIAAIPLARNLGGMSSGLSPFTANSLLARALRFPLRE